MRNEKLHAAVARSTFPSQNVKKTESPGALLEVQMSKNCRRLSRAAHFEVKMNKTHLFGGRCGAKRIFKSKCAKHTNFGPLLVVQMSKNCAALWREASFEVKMSKT